MAIVDLSFANDYVSGSRFGGSSAWEALEDAQKTAALTQAENELSTFRTLISSDTKHKNAVVEQALFIVEFPDSKKRMALQAQGVAQAGILKETYRPGAAGIAICPYALAVVGDDSDQAYIGGIDMELDEEA